MKKLCVLIFFSYTILNIYSQRINIYQTGITAQQNLNAIANLTPYSTGGIGFDTRYEGVEGSPRLFDTLLSSYLLVNDKDFYIKLGTDLNLISNSVLYTDPETKKLFALPADNVKELIVEKDGKELIFRTTRDLKFEKNFKENKFYQVLAEGPVLFIKMPWKIFVEADYKGAYSSDRRYDEYKDATKYYLTGADGALHQIRLDKKSLIRLFPDKKDLINKTPEKKTSDDNEDLVISLVEKL